MKVRSKYSCWTDRGFTLIEIMVVVVIISIILSLAVLSIDTGSRQLENEARRLAALFNIASEETIMNSREYRVVFTRDGYSFYKFEGAGEWTLMKEDILRPRKLPEEYTVLLNLEGEEVEFGKKDSDETSDQAAVYFLSSGEVTPFEVELINSSGNKYVVSNKNGSAEVLIDE